MGAFDARAGTTNALMSGGQMKRIETCIPMLHATISFDQVKKQHPQRLTREQVHMYVQLIPYKCPADTRSQFSKALSAQLTSL